MLINVYPTYPCSFVTCSHVCLSVLLYFLFIFDLSLRPGTTDSFSYSGGDDVLSDRQTRPARVWPSCKLELCIDLNKIICCLHCSFSRRLSAFASGSRYACNRCYIGADPVVNLGGGASVQTSDYCTSQNSDGGHQMPFANI